MLRGVSTFGTTFLATLFLGFAMATFFFLAAGFLALVLVVDLLAVRAVFFFVFAANVFVVFFLPVVVAFFLAVFFATGNARGVLREKKRGRAARAREGRVAEDDEKVGSRPTRFASVLRAGRRVKAWRTSRENIV